MEVDVHQSAPKTQEIVNTISKSFTDHIKSHLGMGSEAYLKEYIGVIMGIPSKAEPRCKSVRDPTA